MSMTSDSPLFDSIRVKPDADRRLRTSCPTCDWSGCAEPATHRAPKGRNREKDYWRFCLDHVRAYNQSYNYFAGMSDDAVAAYQKDALTGHRPTWKMGVNGRGAARRADPQEFYGGFAADDPFNVFSEVEGQSRRERAPAAEARPVRNAERKALDTLGLDPGVAPTDIKARFKELVKRHHPDANGGDRSTEDRLREIIQAYNYLKSVRAC